MKQLFLLLCCAFFSLLLTAQELTLPLWPAGGVPNYQKTGEKEQWDSTDIVRVSLVQTPTMTVFLPAKKIRLGTGCYYLSGRRLCTAGL